MADIPPSFRSSVPDDFVVDITTDGGDLIVAVRGELDVLTAPFLWEQMEPALAGLTGKLVFDFAELGFIDSMGLGVIVRAHSRLRGESVNGRSSSGTSTPTPARSSRSPASTASSTSSLRRAA